MKADEESPARCTLLTVSDSKTPETDESGRMALETFKKFGHEVLHHEIVPNRSSDIKSAIKDGLRRGDLVATIGGTGPSARDGTIEVVRSFVEKELPGFGELFRARSVEEIGTAAILSRALLGVTDSGQILVSMPGSPSAVRLALEEILMEELKHLLWELRRYR